MEIYCTTVLNQVFAVCGNGFDYVYKEKSQAKNIIQYFAMQFLNLSNAYLLFYPTVHFIPMTYRVPI